MREGRYTLTGHVSADVKDVGNAIAVGLDHAKHRPRPPAADHERDFCSECQPLDIRSRREFFIAWQILWKLRTSFADALEFTPEQRRSLYYLERRLALFEHRPSSRKLEPREGSGQLVNLDAWRETRPLSP
jgi:hypothetical protein